MARNDIFYEFQSVESSNNTRFGKIQSSINNECVYVLHTLDCEIKNDVMQRMFIAAVRSLPKNIIITHPRKFNNSRLSNMVLFTCMIG